MASAAPTSALSIAQSAISEMALALRRCRDIASLPHDAVQSLWRIVDGFNGASSGSTSEEAALWATPDFWRTLYVGMRHGDNTRGVRKLCFAMFRTSLTRAARALGARGLPRQWELFFVLADALEDFEPHLVIDVWARSLPGLGAAATPAVYGAAVHASCCGSADGGAAVDEPFSCGPSCGDHDRGAGGEFGPLVFDLAYLEPGACSDILSVAAGASAGTSLARGTTAGSCVWCAPSPLADLVSPRHIDSPVTRRCLGIEAPSAALDAHTPAAAAAAAATAQGDGFVPFVWLSVLLERSFTHDNLPIRRLLLHRFLLANVKFDERGKGHFLDAACQLISGSDSSSSSAADGDADIAAAAAETAGEAGAAATAAAADAAAAAAAAAAASATPFAWALRVPAWWVAGAQHLPRCLNEGGLFRGLEDQLGRAVQRYARVYAEGALAGFASCATSSSSSSSTGSGSGGGSAAGSGACATGKLAAVAFLRCSLLSLLACVTGRNAPRRLVRGLASADIPPALLADKWLAGHGPEATTTAGSTSDAAHSVATATATLRAVTPDALAALRLTVSLFSQRHFRGVTAVFNRESLALVLKLLRVRVAVPLAAPSVADTATARGPAVNCGSQDHALSLSSLAFFLACLPASVVLPGLLSRPAEATSSSSSSSSSGSGSGTLLQKTAVADDATAQAAVGAAASVLRPNLYCETASLLLADAAPVVASLQSAVRAYVHQAADGAGRPDLSASCSATATAAAATSHPSAQPLGPRDLPWTAASLARLLVIMPWRSLQAEHVAAVTAITGTTSVSGGEGAESERPGAVALRVVLAPLIGALNEHSAAAAPSGSNGATPLSERTARAMLLLHAILAAVQPAHRAADAHLSAGVGGGDGDLIAPIAQAELSDPGLVPRDGAPAPTAAAAAASSADVTGGAVLQRGSGGGCRESRVLPVGTDFLHAAERDAELLARALAAGPATASGDAPLDRHRLAAARAALALCGPLASPPLDDFYLDDDGAEGQSGSGRSPSGSPAAAGGSVASGGLVARLGQLPERDVSLARTPGNGSTAAAADSPATAEAISCSAIPSAHGSLVRDDVGEASRNVLREAASICGSGAEEAAAAAGSGSSSVNADLLWLRAALAAVLFGTSASAGSGAGSAASSGAGSSVVVAAVCAVVRSVVAAWFSGSSGSALPVRLKDLASQSHIAFNLIAAPVPAATAADVAMSPGPAAAAAGLPAPTPVPLLTVHFFLELLRACAAAGAPAAVAALRQELVAAAVSQLEACATPARAASAAAGGDDSAAVLSASEAAHLRMLQQVHALQVLALCLHAGVGASAQGVSAAADAPAAETVAQLIRCVRALLAASFRKPAGAPSAALPFSTAAAGETVSAAGAAGGSSHPSAAAGGVVSWNSLRAFHEGCRWAAIAQALAQLSSLETSRWRALSASDEAFAASVSAASASPAPMLMSAVCGLDVETAEALGASVSDGLDAALPEYAPFVVAAAAPLLRGACIDAAQAAAVRAAREAAGADIDVTVDADGAPLQETLSELRASWLAHRLAQVSMEPSALTPAAAAAAAALWPVTTVTVANIAAGLQALLRAEERLSRRSLTAVARALASPGLFLRPALHASRGMRTRLAARRTARASSAKAHATSDAGTDADASADADAPIEDAGACPPPVRTALASLLESMMLDCRSGWALQTLTARAVAAWSLTLRAATEHDIAAAKRAAAAASDSSASVAAAAAAAAAAKPSDEGIAALVSSVAAVRGDLSACLLSYAPVMMALALHREPLHALEEPLLADPAARDLLSAWHKDWSNAATRPAVASVCGHWTAMAGAPGIGRDCAPVPAASAHGGKCACGRRCGCDFWNHGMPSAAEPMVRPDDDAAAAAAADGQDDDEDDAAIVGSGACCSCSKAGLGCSSGGSSSGGPAGELAVAAAAAAGAAEPDSSTDALIIRGGGAVTRVQVLFFLEQVCAAAAHVRGSNLALASQLNAAPAERSKAANAALHSAVQHSAAVSLHRVLLLRLLLFTASRKWGVDNMPGGPVHLAKLRMWQALTLLLSRWATASVPHSAAGVAAGAGAGASVGTGAASSSDFAAVSTVPAGGNETEASASALVYLPQQDVYVRVPAAPDAGSHADADGGSDEEEQDEDDEEEASAVTGSGGEMPLVTLPVVDAHCFEALSLLDPPLLFSIFSTGRVWLRMTPEQALAHALASNAAFRARYVAAESARGRGLGGAVMPLLGEAGAAERAAILASTSPAAAAGGKAAAGGGKGGKGGKAAATKGGKAAAAAAAAAAPAVTSAGSYEAAPACGSISRVLPRSPDTLSTLAEPVLTPDVLAARQLDDSCAASTAPASAAALVRDALVDASDEEVAAAAVQLLAATSMHPLVQTSVRFYVEVSLASLARRFPVTLARSLLLPALREVNLQASVGISVASVMAATVPILLAAADASASSTAVSPEASSASKGHGAGAARLLRRLCRRLVLAQVPWLTTASGVLRTMVQAGVASAAPLLFPHLFARSTASGAPLPLARAPRRLASGARAPYAWLLPVLRMLHENHELRTMLGRQGAQMARLADPARTSLHALLTEAAVTDHGELLPSEPLREVKSTFSFLASLGHVVNQYSWRDDEVLANDVLWAVGAGVLPPAALRDARLRYTFAKMTGAVASATGGASAGSAESAVAAPAEDETASPAATSGDSSAAAAAAAFDAAAPSAASGVGSGSSSSAEMNARLEHYSDLVPTLNTFTRAFTTTKSAGKSGSGGGTSSPAAMLNFQRKIGCAVEVSLASAAAGSAAAGSAAGSAASAPAASGGAAEGAGAAIAPADSAAAALAVASTLSAAAGPATLVTAEAAEPLTAALSAALSGGSGAAADDAEAAAAAGADAEEELEADGSSSSSEARMERRRAALIAELQLRAGVHPVLTHSVAGAGPVGASAAAPASGAITVGASLEAAAARRCQPFIVCASLLTKATNLGGLARTSEIFGLQALVVPDMAVTGDAAFKDVSVSSGAWMTLAECNPSRLLEYLRLKRSQGYTIVGLEQAARSRQLGAFRFPERVVLVLGAELKGMPVEVLNELDAVVEIPQMGFIRSLNVHVSASLLIWEYTRQRIALASAGALAGSVSAPLPLPPADA